PLIPKFPKKSIGNINQHYQWSYLRHYLIHAAADYRLILLVPINLAEQFLKNPSCFTHLFFKRDFIKIAANTIFIIVTINGVWGLTSANNPPNKLKKNLCWEIALFPSSQKEI